MVTALPEYHELYVVSDLHMGGPAPEFQIFHQGGRLGRFVDSLIATRPDDEVALVLNGDIVDSLAEGTTTYVALDGAENMMDRITRDPSFAPAWDALGRFVRSPRRHLILVLGNHDIELALPNVEYWLRNKLTGGNAEAAGRILFATHGSGHTCKVGGARVFCTHGNEVDDWNVVDQDALGDLAYALGAGRRFDSWRPNAGTRLVIDVMNAIKHDYPFVDLLKPETKAVVPILLALDPGRLKAAIGALPQVGANLFWGALERRGFLSADALEQKADRRAGDEAIQNLLGPRFREGLGATAAARQDPDDLLKTVERDVAEGKHPLAPAGPGDVETLGTMGYIIDRLRGVDKAEALRRALYDWLKQDDTFEVTTLDDTFKLVTAQVGPSIDFVVTGHTHLERAIPIPGANRFYYNSGTWVRLLRLTQAVLEDSAEFGRVFQVLRAGTMKDLDNTKVKKAGGGQEDLILSRPAVVRISSTGAGVAGELFHVTELGGNAALDPVPGTQFNWR